MLEQLIAWGPIALALAASLFTWGMTALGAGMVFFFKDINQRVLNGMLGFASGVMIAASFFSLIAPAIDLSAELNMIPWAVVSIGFGAGAVFLWISDHLIPHIHFQDKTNHVEGIPSKL
ncbi:ZIP family metal transporter, partial [Anaerorhabdus sp.]